MENELSDSGYMEMIGSPVEVDNQHLYSTNKINDQELAAHQDQDKDQDVNQDLDLIEVKTDFPVIYNNPHIIVNNPPNYFNPNKRMFLNDCIRRIYLLQNRGRMIHWEPVHCQATRDGLWHQVEYYVQQLVRRLKSRRKERLEHVRRRLFLPDKPSRKNFNPTRNTNYGTTKLFNFGVIRPQIARKRISRNCLHAAKLIVHKEMISERLRQEIIDKPGVDQSVVAEAEGMLNVDANVINDICNFHINVAHTEATENTDKNGRVVEHRRIMLESVLSIYYTKNLFHIIDHEMFDHEELVETTR